MKIVIYCLTLISFSIFSCETKTNKSVFEQTTEKLQTINTLKYSSVSIHRNPYESRIKIDTTTWFFDFSSTDTVLGSKYLQVIQEREYGFDGKNAFYILDDKQVLAYRPAYSALDMVDGIALTYSIYGMRKLFPIFLKDSAFSIFQRPDTLLRGTSYYHLEILMNGKYIGVNGGVKRRDNYKGYFKVIVNKENLLPYQYIHYTSDKFPFLKRIYYDINTNNSAGKMVYDYKLRRKDYLHYTFEELQQITHREREISRKKYNEIERVDWKLPGLNNESVQLSKISSKLVLLEFWFPACGGCIKAIPDLKQIYDLHKENGLQIYGVEFQNAEEDFVRKYINIHDIPYPILHSGKEVAKMYGVSGGPTIFLYNQQRKIVYSSFGFKKEELVKAIEDNI